MQTLSVAAGYGLYIYAGTASNVTAAAVLQHGHQRRGSILTQLRC